MRLKEFFFPKRRDFLGMLVRQTDKTLEGMKALKEFMKEPNPSNSGRVKEIETEADELRLNLINELNASFVTPLDREDIFSLSRAIDDIIDYGQRTVEEMLIYEVKPTLHIQRMVDALLEATKNIDLAMQNLKKGPQVVLQYVIKAKKEENNKDTIYILKMRELYRHLSNSADRCDEAANIISDIVIKVT